MAACCRQLGVSRQSVYQAEKRFHLRSEQLQEVKRLVLQVRSRMPRLGTRKLYSQLKSELETRGIKLGRDALFRFLRNENMLIIPRKRYTKTTNSKHWLKKYPNLLKEVQPKFPEQVVVSDITYIKSKSRVYYLSLVTDAFSRKIMGYNLAKNLETEGVLKALKMAIRVSRLTNGMIHHSDRGLQYASAMYQEVLTKSGMVPSMTDGYDCYQNALAERMNGILKQEFLYNLCSNYEELSLLVDESIKIYNTERPHLSLNMSTPDYVHKNGCKDFSSQPSN